MGDWVSVWLLICLDWGRGVSAQVGRGKRGERDWGCRETGREPGEE